MRRHLLSCIALLAVLATRVLAADLVVRYPNINGMGKEGLGYRALTLALEKSGEPFSVQLVLSGGLANNDRMRAMLEQGDIDVVDFGTSPEFERRYAAVYFPIDRGLNGWRLLLVRDADRAKFKQIDSLSQLAQFRAGQGQGWPDADLLRNAGLPVVTVPTLQNLFPMLAGGRFDYVPLGLNEIDDLLDKYRATAPGITIDRHLLLIYPFGRLFFVRKDDRRLHDAIDAGLRRAFEDGSYQQLLLGDAGYAKALSDPDFGARRRLLIDNPTLTPQFRSIPSRYFFR